MSGAPQPPEPDRAAAVRALFARIARRYDLLNDVQSAGLHRLWKRRLVRLSGAGAGMRALDVCCGTGDIARRLARTGAEVVGLDFSEPMLAVAREKAGCLPHPMPHLRFVQGDALRLPFEEGAFDIVTVGYGLRNLADWETGLREMVRVTKPGGRLLVLDFGKPANPVWRRVYFAYLRFVVPFLGRLLAGDAAAYAYILPSLMAYPAQSGVAARMVALGLEGVSTVNLLGGVMSIHHAVKPRGGVGARVATAA